MAELGTFLPHARIDQERFVAIFSSASIVAEDYAQIGNKRARS